MGTRDEGVEAAFRAELIRIEATRSGRFYPGFKEARHASEGVC